MSTATKKYLSELLKQQSTLTNATEMVFPSIGEESVTPAKPAPVKRSLLNELFDLLSIGQYASLGAISGALNTDESIVGNVAKGVAQGLTILPGWEGFREPASFETSKLLGDMGWNPKGTFGKVQKGVVGFAGDVLLDPLTYISGGTAAILKGTGKTLGKEAAEKLVARAAASGMSDNVIKELRNLAGNGGTTIFSRSSAEEVVREYFTNSKQAFDEKTILEQTDMFYKAINKLRGVDTSVEGVTLSLKNLPFGEKLFPNAGVTQLLSNSQAREVGDKSIAPVVNTIIESFYSSPLGKRFSTKTGMRELSVTHPKKVFNFFRFYNEMKKSNINLIKQLDLVVQYAKDNLKDIDAAKSAIMIDELENPSTRRFFNVLSKEFDKVSMPADERFNLYLKEVLAKNGMDSIKTSKDDVIEKINNINAKRLGKLIPNEDALNVKVATLLRNGREVEAENLMNTWRKYVDAGKPELEKGINIEEEVNAISKSYKKKIKTIKKNAESEIKALSKTKEDILKIKEDIGMLDAKAEGIEDIHASNIESIEEEGFSALESLRKGGMDKEVKYGNKVEYINKLSEEGFDIGKKLSTQREGVEHYLDKELPVININKNTFTSSYERLDALRRVKSKSAAYKEELSTALNNLLFAGKKVFNKNTNEMELNNLFQHITALPVSSKNKESFSIYVQKYLDENDLALSKRMIDVNKYLARKFKYPGNTAYKKQIVAALRSTLKDEAAEPFAELIKNTPLPSTGRLWDFINNFYEFIDEGQRDQILNMVSTMIARDEELKSLKLLGKGQRNTIISTLTSKSDALKGDLKLFDKELNELYLNEGGTTARRVYERTKGDAQIMEETLGKKPYAGLDGYKNLEDVLNDEKNSTLLRTPIHVYEKGTNKLLAKNISFDMLNDTYGGNLDGLFIAPSQIIVDTEFIENVMANRYLPDEMRESLVSSITNVRKAVFDMNNYDHKVTIEKEINTRVLSAKKSEIELMRRELDGLFEEAKEKELNRIQFEEEINNKMVDVESSTKKEISNVKSEMKEALKTTDELFDVENITFTHDEFFSDEGIINLLDADNIPTSPSVADMEFTSLDKRLEALDEALFMAKEKFARARVASSKAKHVATIREIEKWRQATQLRKVLISEEILKAQKLADARGSALSAFHKEYVNASYNPALSNLENIKVDSIRRSFFEMGVKEVDLGLLGEGQFARWSNVYAPGILTPEARAKHYKELVSTRGFITDMFGLKNPAKMDSSKTRTALNQVTIAMANKASLEKDGYKTFIDNIGTIWVSRKLAHDKAIYHEEMSEKLVNELGRLITHGDKISPGHTVGAPYGRVVKYIDEEVKAELKVEFNIALRAANGANKGKLGDWEFQKIYDSIYKSTLPSQIKASVERSMGLTGDWRRPIIKLNEGAVSNLTRKFDAPNPITGEIDVLDFSFPMNEIPDAIIDFFNHKKDVEMAMRSSELLAVFDKAQNMWKRLNTVINPSFHGRNFPSNQWNSFLGIGTDITDMKMQKGAFTFITNKKNANEIVFGDKTWQDMWDEAKGFDLVGSGYFDADMASKATTEILGDAGIEVPTEFAVEGFKRPISEFITSPAAFNPFSEDFILAQGGRALGSRIENRDKLIHYISLRKRGASPQDTADSVNHFMFNYNDLTQFEHTVMKRVFPFYTWIKKNIQLQTEQMVVQPETYRLLNKMFQSIEGSVDEENRVDRNDREAWLQGMIQTPFSIEGKSLYTDPIVPLGDIDKLPANASPLEAIRSALGIASPFIKVPVELATNKQYFFDKPIYKEGSTKEDILKYLGRQFSPISSTMKVSDAEGINKAFSALKLATGINLAQGEVIVPTRQDVIEQAELLGYEAKDVAKDTNIVNMLKTGIKYLIDNKHILFTPPTTERGKYYKAQVILVVDGDTLLVRNEDGTEEKVRMTGVNTPEMKTSWGGEAAKAYTEEMLGGRTIYLEKDVEVSDAYKRALRYVWLDVPNPGNEDYMDENLYTGKLITSGNARTFSFKPNNKYYEYFNKLQEEKDNDKEE